MVANRRDFLRWVGLGAAAAAASPASALAERIRILGGAAPSGPSMTDEGFRRFLGSVRVGRGAASGGVMVFWLHGDFPGEAMAIATLEEARSRGDLLIRERDQASVPELIGDNRGKAFVLLLAGEIVVGGKQNRVLSEDILLPPFSGPRNIEVYCVEQGRWAGRRKDFEAKGTFAAPALRSRLMEKAEQGRVWGEVDHYARIAGAASPTRSYQDIYDRPEVQAHLKDVAGGLDVPAPGALGSAVFVGEAFGGLDLFHDPALFAREWPKLLRAQALEAYRQAGRPDPDGAHYRGRVEAVLARAAVAEGGSRSNAGVGHLFEFRLDSARGTALLYDGRLVHAAIL